MSDNKIPMTPNELLTDFLDKAHEANYSVSQANLAKEALEKAFKAGAKAVWHQAATEGQEAGLTEAERAEKERVRKFYPKMNTRR